MTRRGICAMATVYTATMAVVLSLGFFDGLSTGTIVFCIAQVWFHMGRLSKARNTIFDEPAKWGRG